MEVMNNVQQPFLNNDIFLSTNLQPTPFEMLILSICLASSLVPALIEQGEPCVDKEEATEEGVVERRPRPRKQNLLKFT